MCREAAPGPAAASRSHHPQRPLRRRPAGGGCHFCLGGEGEPAAARGSPAAGTCPRHRRVFELPALSNQVSKKYVSKELAKEIHAKAAPFVKWLKEAEEESEGSEEEEEEEDENVEVRLFAGFRVDKRLCALLR